jgi:chromosome segregation protein
MSQNDLPTFERGAEWVRADFHLHTIKDPGPSRAFRAEYAGRENDFAKEWIARLTTEKIRVAVVTNHNFFDREEYKVLRKQGVREGILVLPGVELGVKEGGGGTHTLIVFNPDGWVFNEQNDDRIKRFIDSQFVGVPNEGSRTQDDLCGCLEALDAFGHDYFVVFAHVQSDNGLFEEIEGSNLAHVIGGCGKRWRERVLGLQKVKQKDVLRARWPDSVPWPALVEGSDPKVMSEVGFGERRCFLKIGELTFDSVKFALHDWRQRVSSEMTPVERRPRLHRIAFKGGLLNGQSFGLSDQLSCLIGSRGSGKSSVIECLRYGLGLESGESDLKYKNGLVSAMLANGGELSVTGVSADGFLFEIRRPLGYDPVVRLEGKDTRLRPSDILPGQLYFGQKDLGHRHPGFEDDLFVKLVGLRNADERADEETRIAAVRQAVDGWRSVLRASEKEQEYSQEEERLRHQLAVYRERGVEKHLVRLTTFDADKRNLAEFLERLQTLRLRLDRGADDWDDVANDWPILKSEVLEVQAGKVNSSKNEFEGVRADHAAALRRMDALLVSVHGVLSEVMEKERQLQEEFAALQREIDAPGLNLEEFRARKSRHEQLVKLLKAAENRSEMAAQALAQVEHSARALHDLWREWHRQEFQKLEAKAGALPDSIRLSIEFEANREELRSFLKSQFAGSGFRSTSIDRLVEEFPNGFTLFQRRAEIEKVLAGGTDSTKCHSLLLENLAEILTFRVPDQRTILFNGVPIQDLSLGQRATALLQLLMSLEDHPIFLLDQPEDDLDNETIFRHVVEPLLERKSHSQFIIATHNPNIPVLGDAEIVHACHEQDKGRYDHTSGSLDSSATRDAIVSIMEGGAQAFEQRQKIYSQWTNSLFEKNS